MYDREFGHSNMFGSKLKTWMENHIVRPKRKNQHDKDKFEQAGGKGPILESSESLAQSDTGISSESQQVLSSSNTDNNEGYCTTTMESNRSGMAHCHTAVNLSSPESAYSTGYSTDGTSPGGTGPPEYYINIRTGKHYFPSPAPTPTSPQPSTAFSQLLPSVSITTSFLTSDAALSSMPSFPSQLSALEAVTENAPLKMTANTSACQPESICPNGFAPPLTAFLPDSRARTVASDMSSLAPNHLEKFSFSKSPAKKMPPKSPLSTLKSFLKSPKQDKVKPKPDDGKVLTLQIKKKVTSPVKNKKWYKQPFQKFGHRRTDSTDGVVLKNEAIKKEFQLDRNLFFLSKDNAASPRQRNRIRTNPWLPTEHLPSQNFHNIPITFYSNVTRNRSCTNTPLQNRKTDELETVQTRLRDLNVKYDDSKECITGLENAINRGIGQKLMLEISDHSEEDLTLNEMMGTYNESYVYEKETDILSDSDPTDCEDYVSDSEADNGGDEQDSHDDELDFIDNGSIVEGDVSLKNTGKCTYHDIFGEKNNFLFKANRHHSRSESDGRKSFKKNADSKKRRVKDEKRKKSFRRSIRNPEIKVSDSPNVALKAEPPKVMNMSKLLMERADGRFASRSADGTPVCLRRRQLDIRKKSPLTSGGLEDDVESDKKYNQLILEAENIFVRMQNSPIIRERKRLSDAKKETESLDIWKKTEMLCSSKLTETIKKPEVTPRKNLGLSLAVEPKKPKELGFCSKNAFKAKSSAHSPLDPLGPTFRNFTIFKEPEKKISSSSDDSESSKSQSLERKLEVGNGRATPNVVPIAFQSVDLGKQITTYCPQSEPVKRKIYSCSKTYDKLVRRFENESKVCQREEHTRTLHSENKNSDSFEFVSPQEGGGIQVKRPRENAGHFFYNPVYLPYSSPVGQVPRESVSRRLAYDVDVIR